MTKPFRRYKDLAHEELTQEVAKWERRIDRAESSGEGPILYYFARLQEIEAEFNARA